MADSATDAPSPAITANTHVQVLEVKEVIVETADAVSVVLEVPERLVHRFRYLPGQFLTVRIPSDRTGSVARCYSLSSSPHLDDELIITVKRTRGGYASNWICDNVRPGDRLTVLSPSGKFVPRSLHQDLLLVGAGSGATPLLSIAKSALIGGVATIYMFYANDDHGSVIFGAELDELMQEFPDRLTVEHWMVDARGIPTAKAIAEHLAPYSHFDVFLCGPVAFMDVARTAMASVGVPDHNVHTETYQSLAGDPFADIVIPPFEAGDDAAQATVWLADGTRVEVAWPGEVPLLDVLLSGGHDAPYSCREGACSACACSIRSGEVRLRRNDTLTDADIRRGLTLACQAVPLSDTVEIAFDQ